MPSKPTGEPEKDPKPQSSLQAMAAGLSVASEPGLSVLDRLGPAIVGLLHLAVLGLIMFEVVNPVAAAAVLAFTGPVAAGWSAKLGAKPKA